MITSAATGPSYSTRAKQDLVAPVLARSGPHQVPNPLEIGAELPTTAVGTIDKKVLRARRWADRARQIH